MKRTQGITEHFLRLRKRLSKWNKVIVTLAAVVVFATTYALILPAVTLNKDAASQDPAINLDQQMQEFNPKLQAKTKDGDYTVGITYGDDAEIPDDAELKVTELKKDSDDYKNAKKAVVKSRKEAAEKQNQTFYEDDLGLAALDISIVDANGNKIEPKNNAKVQVKITSDSLPAKAAANGFTVQHIVQKKTAEAETEDAQADDTNADTENTQAENANAEETATENASSADAGNEEANSGVTLDTVKRPSIRRAPAAQKQQAEPELVAQPMGGTVSVDGDKGGTAEFSVDSFSVYTITWDKSATDNTRLGNITVNYIGSDDLEKDVAENSGLSSEDMLKYTDGIVKMAELGNKDGQSRVEGYTYDHAVIESRRGKTITGLQLKRGTEERTEMTGPNSDTPVTVSVTTYNLYYTTDDNVSESSHWVEYKDSISENSANNVDVFLVYKKHTKEVDVYYTDLAGKPIDGAPVKKYDVSEWSNGTHNFLTDAQSYTPDGYVAFPKGDSPRNVNTIESPRWWIPNDPTKNNTDNYIVYVTNSFVSKNGTSNNFGLETSRDVRGYAIDTMTYNAANGSMNIQRAHNSTRDYAATSSALPASDTEPYKVYIMYRKKITIHDVDANGNELDTRTNDNWYVGFDPKAWNSHYAGSSLVNSTLGTPSSVYVQNGNDKVQADLNNFDIAWNFSGAAGYENINQSNDGSTYGTIKDGQNVSNGTGSWNTRIKTGSGTSDSDYTTLNNQLITDVYMVYDNACSVKVHHFDAQGNQIADDTTTAMTSGGTLDPTSLQTNVDGYTYGSAHIESATGSPFTAITYNKADGDNGAWTSTVTNDDQTVSAANPLTNEIWLVYNKAGKQLTVHYQYTGTDGANHDAFYLNDGGDNRYSQSTVTVSGDGDTYLVKNPDGTYAENIKNGNVYRDPQGTETGNQKLTFISSHLGSPDGPIIDTATLDSKGDLKYRLSFTVTANPSTNARNVTRWVAANNTDTQKGRQLAINREDDGTLTLQDSQNGSMSLNLRNDQATASDGSGVTVNEQYTAAFHGEHTTTEYTVTPHETTAQDGTGRQVTTYEIEVRDSIISSQTDIYQMYIDGDPSSTGDEKVWINDDMKYSGLFRVGLSQKLSDNLANADTSADTGMPNVTYEWHRIEVPQNQDIPMDLDELKDIDQLETATDGSSAQYPLVTRKQTGDHYNISSTARTADWLDVEAEEGDATWRYGTKRAYYVKVTYVKDGVSHTLRSVPVTINYYGQLENGSFETPVLTGSEYSWTHKTTNPFTGYLSNEVSEAYGAPGGIWKTTQPSTIAAGADGYQADIELVNTRNSGYKTAYNPSAWTQHEGARDGSQFAELNAEAPGALYQDVITHPNEQLSYQFSHRARGDNGKADQYDSMYLVIMPTKLAMTSGDDNTELKTQTELEQFIREHGGYDTNAATGIEDRITYSDSKNGILIRKVSSSNMDWHDISAVNGYTAKGGLTRFFFVAGKTASTRTDGRANTVGNFLDNVGFSQELSKPDGFNLTVSKTFTGLTRAQVEAMATNATDAEGHAISNPFTLTISNKNVTDGSGAANDALNGAKLQFRYDSGTSSRLVATAVDKDGKNLLGSGSGNTGAVRINSDGTVTISWTFTNQALKVGSAETPDQTYQYTVTETKGSGASASAPNLDGYTRTSTVAANTGVQWVQYYVAKYNDDGTFTPDERTNIPQDIDTSRGTTVSNQTNLIAAQVYNGAKTGYVVWTPEYVDETVKKKIVDHINSLGTWTHNGESDKAYLQDTAVTENGQTKTIAPNVAFVYGSAGTEATPFNPQHDESNSESVKSFLDDNKNMAMNYTVGSNGSNNLRFIDSVREEPLDEKTDARSINIGEGTQAQMRFTNSYREKNSSQMTVQKVFTGVTKTTVLNDLLRKGYYIQLTKTHDNDGKEISGTKPTLKLDQTAGRYENVTFDDIQEDKNTGKVTLTWHIRDLEPDSSDNQANSRMGGPGIYSVKEVGYAPTEAQTTLDNNTLTQIVINGKNQTFKDTNGDLKTEKIDGKDVACVTQTGIRVGNVGANADASVPRISDSGSDSNPTLVSNELKANETVAFQHNPNLAVARAVTAEHQTEYMVWTLDPAGSNMRQAIINFINAQKGFGASTGTGNGQDETGVDATSKNVRFYDGFGDGSNEMVFDSQYPLFKLSFSVTGEGDNRQVQATFEDGYTDADPHWVRYLSMNYKVNDGAQYDENDNTTGVTDGMTNNDTEVRVANSYDPIVKIRKTNTPSGAAAATTLPGGVFRVYKKDANGNKQYYLTTGTPTDPKFGTVDNVDQKDANGKYVNTSGERVTSSTQNKALSFTTGDDGTISIGALVNDGDSNGKSQPTNYWLEEIQAPGGYNLVEDIPFVLNADGTVQLVGPKDKDGEDTYSSKVDPATVTWDDPYYTITVKDEAGVLLPSTGGPGDNILLALAGLALVVLAAGGAVMWRRRPMGRHGA